MARALKAGDLVRTVEGVERVTAVEPAPRRKVSDLHVDRSFFANGVGAMVRDNSPVRTTSSAFDRGPELARAAEGIPRGRSMNEAIRGRIAAQIGSEAGRDRLAALAARMSRGDDAGAIMTSDGATGGDLVAATVLAALNGDGPALVRPAQPKGRPGAITPSAISRIFPDATREACLSVCAGLLQILDFWEMSHEAAQQADDGGETVFAPYWHAIAHRREPDPGNAGYWFRRVGRHALFVDVAAAAGAVLGAHGDVHLKARLMPRGAWDPMAFVAFCGEAARRPGSEDERVARRIQRAEMIALLNATVP